MHNSFGSALGERNGKEETEYIPHCCSSSVARVTVSVPMVARLVAVVVLEDITDIF